MKHEKKAKGFLTTKELGVKSALARTHVDALQLLSEIDVPLPSLPVVEQLYKEAADDCKTHAKPKALDVLRAGHALVQTRMEQLDKGVFYDHHSIDTDEREL